MDKQASSQFEAELHDRAVPLGFHFEAWQREGKTHYGLIAHGIAREFTSLSDLNTFLCDQERARIDGGTVQGRMSCTTESIQNAPFVQPPPVFVSPVNAFHAVELAGQAAQEVVNKTASQVRAEAEAALAKAHDELTEAARIAREQATERATAEDKKTFLMWADVICQSLGWGFNYCAEDNHYALTPPAPRPIIHLYSRVAVQNCLEAATREHQVSRAEFPDSPAHTYKPFTDKTR